MTTKCIPIVALTLVWLSEIFQAAHADQYWHPADDVHHAREVAPLLADPGDFDWQFDWFQPLYHDLPDAREPNTGWFFAYDRVNVNVTRPDESQQILFAEPLGPDDTGPPVPGEISAQEANDQGGDWTWGNRFDFGYMSDEGAGWWMTAWKIDNPRVIMQNVWVDRNGAIVNDLLGNPVGTTFVTLNAFNVYGFEINRVWRMRPTYKGLIFEPFLGPRYIRVRDHYDRNDYIADRPQPPATGPAGATLTFVNFDDYRFNEVFTDNDLYGGQVGLRTHFRRGRWLLSTDIRGLTLHNFRDRRRQERVELNTQNVLASYDANGNLAAIAVATPATEFRRTFEEDESNNFSWGGELRLDAWFDLTKNFSLHAGGEFLVLADGVGRGFLLSNDSFGLAGVTFGFAVNR